jgi:hypothetical protein
LLLRERREIWDKSRSSNFLRDVIGYPLMVEGCRRGGRRYGLPLRNGAVLSEAYATELGHLKLPLSEPRNRTFRPEDNDSLQPSKNCEFCAESRIPLKTSVGGRT